MQSGDQCPLCLTAPDYKRALLDVNLTYRTKRISSFRMAVLRASTVCCVSAIRIHDLMVCFPRGIFSHSFVFGCPITQFYGLDIQAKG